MDYRHLGLSSQQAYIFKNLLVSGSQKIKGVLETMLGHPVRRQQSSYEISDAREVLTLPVFDSDNIVTITSKLDGDMTGTALLLMRSRDFTSICTLLSQSGPYASQVLDSQVPDWVRRDKIKDSASVENRELMFDAVAEIANAIFGGYLLSTHEVFSLNTFHSVPKAEIDSRQVTFNRFISGYSTQSPPILVAENRFVMLPHEFKVWFLLSPDKTTFNELLILAEKLEKVSTES